MMNKIKRNNIYIFICIIYVILGFTLYGQGNKLYGLGFHGLDLAHNMQLLEAKYNITLFDTATNFKTYYSDEVYIIGIKQQDLGSTMKTVGALLFGVGLMGYATVNKKLSRKGF